MPNSEQLLQNVHRYYDLVDEGDVPGLVRLFSAEAVYERPGYEPIRGRTALARFYRETRVIESGRHTVHTALCDPRRVAVQGEFEGTLKSMVQVRLRFADFFEATADGLFTRRHTYFFQPMV